MPNDIRAIECALCGAFTTNFRYITNRQVLWCHDCINRFTIMRGPRRFSTLSAPPAGRTRTDAVRRCEECSAETRVLYNNRCIHCALAYEQHEPAINALRLRLYHTDPNNIYALAMLYGWILTNPSLSSDNNEVIQAKAYVLSRTRSLSLPDHLRQRSTSIDNLFSIVLSMFAIASSPSPSLDAMVNEHIDQIYRSLSASILSLPVYPSQREGESASICRSSQDIRQAIRVNMPESRQKYLHQLYLVYKNLEEQQINTWEQAAQEELLNFCRLIDSPHTHRIKILELIALDHRRSIPDFASHSLTASQLQQMLGRVSRSPFTSASAYERTYEQYVARQSQRLAYSQWSGRLRMREVPTAINDESIPLDSHSDGRPADLPDPYHHNSRDYKNVPANAIGVELEVHSTKRPALVRLIREQGFFAETDGSISRSNGVEIIGLPLTLASYQSSSGKWQKLFAAFNDLNVAIPSDNYGMHINLSRHEMLRVQVQRIFDIVRGNEYVWSKIAGRRGNQYCAYQAQGDEEEETDPHHQAVNTSHNDRLEVRIFKATTTYSQFLACIELCVALREFTRLSVPRMNEFFAWLKHQPYNAIKSHPYVQTILVQV